MKTVLTVGVYDLLHWGHFELFRRAKELAGPGGRLVVAVQEDAVVTKYKPQAKLVYNWDQRVKMISALRYVDEVVPYGDIDESIKGIGFDVFAIGGATRRMRDSSARSNGVRRRARRSCACQGPMAFLQRSFEPEGRHEKS